MEIIALALLIASAVIGFIALFFTTFGTLIIFIGAALYALLTEFTIVHFKDLAVLFMLYVCGEALEYILIIIGAKKFGASNAAVVGALIGGILGAVAGTAFLGVGLIVGTFLGIFSGAFLVEYMLHRDVVRSLKAGTGGVLGRVGSIAAKVIISIIMFAILATRIVIAVSAGGM